MQDRQQEEAQEQELLRITRTQGTWTQDMTMKPEGLTSLLTRN